MNKQRELFGPGEIRASQKNAVETLRVRKKLPQERSLYQCPRCGGTMETFINIAAGRCPCGGACSLLPNRRRDR